METINGPDGTKFEFAALDSLIRRTLGIWEKKFVPEYLMDKSLFAGFNAWDEIEIGLHPHVLVEAITNARTDIIRWSMFHLSGKCNGKPSRPDRHKYGGFLAKWIAKERPIYIAQRDPTCLVDLPEQLYRLNSFFAVTVLQSYLHSTIPLTLADELAYILHFREEKGETYALLGYCAEQMPQKHSPSSKESDSTDRKNKHG